jgi:nucleoside-diphosphate-sugar epimerase
MKVLVFGGEGYIGKVLVKQLVNKNYKVTSYDNLIYFSRKITNNRNYNFIYGDIIDSKNIKKIINNYDYAIILAGLVGDPVTKKYKNLSKRINYRGIRSLIKICSNSNLKKVIFVSTCSNYGIVPNNIKPNENYKLQPLSLYSKDKVQAEKYIMSLKSLSKAPFTILRFATAFGVSERMRFDLTVNEFVLEILKKKILNIYDKDTYRPYCHVKDFARAILLVIKTKKIKTNYEIFNVGDNKNNFTKNQIINKILRYLPYNKIKFTTPNPPVDARDYNVDFSKINSKLGFKSKYSLEYGIKELIKYIVDNNFHKTKKKFGNYKIYI